MAQVKLHKLNAVDYSSLTRVVCVARYKGKFVYCKHKDRSTWELPGGHIEKGEDWLTAAKREMFEETGTIQATYEPICLYSISTYAMLCFVEIESLSNLPNSEIEKIEFFDKEPSNLTYPEAHSLFLKTVLDYKNLKI